MGRKIIGILIVGLLIGTVFPCVNASINKTSEKENTTFYESSLFGIGFVRIHEVTHVLKGFVLFGINDGHVISTELINIKFVGEDGVFAGYCSPLIFFFRYNPAE